MFTCLRFEHGLIDLQRGETRDHFVENILLIRLKLIRRSRAGVVLTKIFDASLPITDLQRKKSLYVGDLSRHVDEVGVNEEDLIHVTADELINCQSAYGRHGAKLGCGWKIAEISNDRFAHAHEKVTALASHRNVS